MWDKIVEFTGGDSGVSMWLILFILGMLFVSMGRIFFRARKIQPNGFKWKTLRNEVIFAVIGISISGFVLGWANGWLTDNGFHVINTEPTEWYVIAAEYALYFFGFDTYFYWLHRLMHKEPIYKWVHKLHHFSTAPNPMTTFSVTPLESIINGFWVPIYLIIFPVHAQTLAFVIPTAVLMGVYVHSGYEFLPSWWNKTWATKWFITATFHDHHHHYFRFNFGGYTTIWDYLCGTVHKNYERDFEKITTRKFSDMKPRKVQAPAAGV